MRAICGTSSAPVRNRLSLMAPMRINRPSAPGNSSFTAEGLLSHRTSVRAYLEHRSVRSSGAEQLLHPSFGSRHRGRVLVDAVGAAIEEARDEKSLGHVRRSGQKELDAEVWIRLPFRARCPGRIQRTL